MKTIHASQALLPDGWSTDVTLSICKDGRISEVLGSNSSARHGKTKCVHVPILLPAPVNLHSHAFQRAMAGLTETRSNDSNDSFWTWRRLMYRFTEQLDPMDIEAITAFVQMEMLESGYAVNTEFHYLHHQTNGQPYDNVAELSERIIAATQASGIGLTLLPVFYQYGGCDRRAPTASQRRFVSDLKLYERMWLEARNATKALPADTRIGVAPHSLRAVTPETLDDLLQIAPEDPVHMHIAEQLAEVTEFAANYGKRPMRWLLDNMPVDSRWCLIHCTQMTSQETRALADTGAVAGLCPITESSLGDGIFNGVEFHEAGGCMGIGSDSNIRISLSEELRTLEYSQRLRDNTRAAFATTGVSTGRCLYDSIVKGGAQASGRLTGRIEKGYWADLLALNSEDINLHGRTGDKILDGFIFTGDDRLVTDVWAAGRHLVHDGRHIRRDTIEHDYRKTMNKLSDIL